MASTPISWHSDMRSNRQPEIYSQQSQDQRRSCHDQASVMQATCEGATASSRITMPLAQHHSRKGYSKCLYDENIREEAALSSSC